LYSLLLGCKFQRDCHLFWMTEWTLTKKSVAEMEMLVIGDNEGVFARRSTYTKKAEMCISTQATKKAI